MPKTSTESRAWIAEAIRRVDADANRSADTHLHVLPIPVPGIELYLKDESVHPTGSLKHRLARSLFLYALCNGWLGPESTVIEASSGSTAVSEAYFARLIGLPFVAVMPATTSPEKIALIEFYGGRCHLVDDPGTVYDVARELADACGGHYMDQFTYAERATDWRGNNNIAESIYQQMSAEPHPCPTWIVVSAGTGGTSATIGRYVRYRRLETRVAVADPENSAFFGGWAADRSDVTTGQPSRIEGIGRMRVEPSFVGGVIDDMVQVPDAASIATMRWVSGILGRPVGGSTGTNVWASLELIGRMRDEGEDGSVVTLLCDGGERYAHTYYDDAWLAAKGIDIAPYSAALAEFAATGTLPR
ncbi:L-cysteine desulfhydrase Cds1 [Aeromicrobium wangtongii]|uniref:L-cysteine desulfhydrase Cds1 n=1 Tax=Aeromicrobium wangtongii TaxID=2969247 RepID=A0ABY5M852_9ACTN|nr:PLP-dependent cysteine synthase family protein [Aeromicrobium wangtongii]MCD9200048.1 PLP-dependent cysteine synthase family protein [Aeromicrobium wangtongii]UUP13306.1 PLP-dependent cysteine synthase family protein [Aeromicrobium wangtongii]